VGQTVQRNPSGPFHHNRTTNKEKNGGASGHGYIYYRRIDVVGGIDDQVMCSLSPLTSTIIIIC
jgi:hypothetical protein